jgi:hypothetical protein
MMPRLPALHCLISLPAALAVAVAAAAADPSWLERSDRHSAMVMERLGSFQPEHASQLGVERFDTAVLDNRPGDAKRFDSAARRLLEQLSGLRARETHPRVRQDLDILIDAVARMRHTRALEHRLLVPYSDLSKHVFEGLQVLLDARNGESRRRNALQRMRVYAGLEPGVTPFAELARARASERFAIAGLVWPHAAEVRQHLQNCERYIAGIAELFRASEMRDWQGVHERLASQLRAHCEWVREVVLPRARTDHTLPAELYADRLKSAGVDITPEQAISLGMLAFAELREDLSRLAAQIARERKLDSGDYRQVLRELKRQQVPPERILALYRERLKQIEDIIVREQIITLPARPASIRLASEAESAAIPAPYMNAPRLIGNQGERGEFVLPLRNPNAQSSALADDFTAEAAAWSTTAHEARPGHELQFSAMLERGVSIARAAFAFNSTNVEGWGLYAESVMLPYFPADGQLFALQLRLLRAARAFLDPMVNLGRMTPAAAKDFLMSEVVISEPMAQQEADRYAFVWPGQAVSYLYGYARLRELRLKAEVALGPRFEQRRFHDTVIAQGLLPPKLLEQAVMEELDPAYRRTSTIRAAPDGAGSRPSRDASGRW